MVRTVVREAAVAEHAVRHLLVADALVFAVALPPSGVPAPMARSSEVASLPPLSGSACTIDHPAA